MVRAFNRTAGQNRLATLSHLLKEKQEVKEAIKTNLAFCLIGKKKSLSSSISFVVKYRPK